MRASDRNRLVACRACGNRVARETRRCPACGAREPTATDVQSPAPPSRPKKEPRPAEKKESRPAASRPPRRAGQRRRRVLVLTWSVLLIATAAGVAAIYLTTPPLPPAVEIATAPAPTVAPPPQPVLLAPAVPSRSRGRTDWLFFFRPGDWLMRMNDDVLLGVVVRVEKTHAFSDGSSGPAYVVQSMEGEERVLDADELERTARLR